MGLFGKTRTRWLAATLHTSPELVGDGEISGAGRNGVKRIKRSSTNWGISSPGRALPLQGRGNRFESDMLHYPPTNVAMKTYPSIDREVTNQPIYAFDKLDGNNIRAEWSRKKGFWKFGSRGRLFDPSDELVGETQQLVLDKYGDDLAKIFREQRWQKAIGFFELHGPRSFIGQHHPEDKKTVTLFDVAGDKKGILEPRNYLRIFGDLAIAPLLYQGNSNNLFAAEVEEGRLEGMTFEGVVCKGKNVSPGRPQVPLTINHKDGDWRNSVEDNLEVLCPNCHSLTPTYGALNMGNGRPRYVT